MIKPRNQNTPKTRTSEIIHHSIFSLYTIIIKVQFGLCDAIKIFTQSVYLQPSQKNLKGVQSFYRQSAYLQKDPTGLKEKLLYLKSIRKKEKTLIVFSHSTTKPKTQSKNLQRVSHHFLSAGLSRFEETCDQDLVVTSSVSPLL